MKRNIERFPEDFYFQLSKSETNYLWFQSGTANKMSRVLPYVFTEQGVAMLSSVLHTNIANITSINIMRAFVSMKKYISVSLIEQKFYNKRIIKHDNDIKLLQESFNKLSNKESSNHIFFEGQIYDAYSLMKDILNTSKDCILIIDTYIDKNLLDILSKIKKNITIITNKYNNEDYNIYNKQYKNIQLIISNLFHDRFIIIDNKVLYHSGSSFKDLGKKCFAITKLDDKEILSQLLKKILKETKV